MPVAADGKSFVYVSSLSPDTGGDTLAASIDTNQKTVGATATLIVPYRKGRRAVTIVQESATLVRYGNAGVTMATGAPLPGSSMANVTIESAAAIYGIVASGTASVSYFETF